MIEKLSRDDVADILYGATIYGAGGGGGLAEGFDLLDRAVEAGKVFRLAELSDVPDDALIATPYLLGALSKTPQSEQTRYIGLPRAQDHPVLLAHRRMEAHLGADIFGSVPCELGGSNTAVPFFVAAMTGGVTVDADPAGRAVPEITHSAYYLAGLPASPIAAANTFGEVMILDNIADDQRAETVVRALCQVSANDIAAIDHALPARDLRGILMPGTLRRAQALGKLWREGRSEPRKVIDQLARAGGGKIAFEGRVAASTAQTQGGFTVGEFTVDGIGADNGNRYRVSIKNENMAGWKDDVLDACIPDIISVFDVETSEVVTNPHVKVGCHVSLVILPAPEVFASARGRAVFGPAYLGLRG
ncbi:MAG: DUF917 domain-containing protein [Pseudomonadota bacterium]